MKHHIAPAMMRAIPLIYDVHEEIIQKHITNYRDFRRYLVLAGKTPMATKLLQNNIFHFVDKNRKLVVYGDEVQEIPFDPRIDMICFKYGGMRSKMLKNFAHIKKYDFTWVNKLDAQYIADTFPNAEEIVCYNYDNAKNILAVNKKVKTIHFQYIYEMEIDYILANQQIEFVVKAIGETAIEYLESKCGMFIPNLKVELTVKSDEARNFFPVNYEVTSINIVYVRSESTVCEVYPQFRNVRKLTFTLIYEDVECNFRVASLPNLEMLTIHSARHSPICEIVDIDFLIVATNELELDLIYDRTRTNILRI